MDNKDNVESQCVHAQLCNDTECVVDLDNVIKADNLRCRKSVESLIIKRLETSQPQTSTRECCIYRVPKILRKLNEAAYTPRLVSIGPFHRGNEELQHMKSIKNRYLQAYLDRTEKSIEELLIYIIDHKERLKSCYAESIEFDESIVEMILVDAVFIIELLLRYHDYIANKSQKHNDLNHIAENNQKSYGLNQTTDVIIDLCYMLENQLPFFIIKGLYETGSTPDNVAFRDLATLLCSDTIRPRQQLLPEAEDDVKHFLDMQRKLILPPKMAPVSYTMLKTARIFATVLHEAGVTFKVCKSQSFLDINFANGKLEMPPFTFERSTETLIRNLMAYEQCHYESETYLCDYFSLMDNLINTSKDVDLLVKNKIIINWLGDNDEVATLVNNLSKHVRFSHGQFYYSKLCEDLNNHCNYRWNKWFFTLKRDYLSTPWKVASTIAAIILLFLTLIQTVCSVISLFKKK